MNEIVDQEYQGISFIEQPLSKAKYENCHFQNCQFQNFDLSYFDFEECVFEECDLTMVKMVNTSFRGSQFKRCKLTGVSFHDCNEFWISLNFDSCQMEFTSFRKLPLKKTKFISCILHEADFTESNLSLARFEDCDLSKAIFDETNLEGADFRGSLQFSIDPEKNRIKKAIFSNSELGGLLHKYDIQIE